MVRRVTRRMRCEVQGCHKAANFGLGLRGNDYPLCEAHLRMLVEEASAFLGEEKPKEAEKPVEAIEKEEENTSEAAEKPVEEDAPKEEEYYECKYCGGKFLKSEYTTGKFAAHVRACKKEHTPEEDD